MPQVAVLIVADDPDFARTVIARWQTERAIPAFRHLGSRQGSESRDPACDLVIVGPVPDEVLPSILETWDRVGRPLIVVARQSQQIERIRRACPRALTVREQEGWLDVLMVLAAEVLRRLEAINRALHAEQAYASVQTLVTLGRYMLDMRHSFSNALTSVLGNSELLLLEPGAFSAEVREQIATIHNMAVRMHEILQRFSSLQNEMQVAGRGSGEEKHRVAPSVKAESTPAQLSGLGVPAIPNVRRR